MRPRHTDRAEHRAEQRGAAADRDTDQEGDRRQDADLRRRDEADDGREQRPGDAGEQRGDGIGHDLDVGRVVAEEAHPFLSVTHRHQQLAVAALHQLAYHRDHDQQHYRGDEVQHPPVRRVVEGEPEERAKPVEAVATSEAGLPDQQDGQRRRERLRQDREVGALDAPLEYAEAQRRRDGRRQHHDGQQRECGGGERLPVRGQFAHPGDLHEVGHLIAANCASAILRCMPIM